jgi:para-nitrobenzyl esterase
MVWIYGGGFMWGSTLPSIYDGSMFARDGVVLVTINYRVGAFGFLYLDELFPEIAGSGNAGLLDQIRALEWVQDNIARFGGDPNNVTIFGESAGGCAVATLLAAPAAAGLFRRAIIQSGTTTSVHSREGATLIARRALDILEVRPGDTDGIESAPTPMLVDLVQRLSPEVGEILGEHNRNPFPLPFSPVVDGEALRRPPDEEVARGGARDVELLMGWCANEFRNVLLDLSPEIAGQVFGQMLGMHLGRRSMSPSDVLAAYRRTDPAAAELDLILRAMADATFRVPTLQLAACQLAHRRDVWLYEFAWPTPIHEGRLGTPHTLEIPFVFDRLVAPELHGPNPPQALADAVHGAWVNFASTGELALEGAGEWPRYTLSEPSCMELSEKPSVVSALHPSLRDVWEPYLSVA